MSFEYFIGSRYLRARRKQAFISLSTLLSIAGVTFGVMTLIVVIAVMSGAESDFKARILGVMPHVMLIHQGGPFLNYHRVLDDVKHMDGVEAATPFVYAQAMLRSSSGVSGVVLKGIEPESAGKVITVLDEDSLRKMSKINENQSATASVPGIILGKELATKLSVRNDDTVSLMSSRGTSSSAGQVPVKKWFKVIGIFDSGLYEYDASLAYIHVEEAQKIWGMGDSVTGIEVRVKDIYEAEDVARRIVDKLGFPYWARDWMRMNYNMFSALKLQKTVMFIILILIILVAAFNIASALIMMVMEKTKDIAILKAMGATDQSIRKIFVFKGMVIGSVGTIMGLCFGSVLCSLLKHYQFIELDPEIYPFTTLPVKLELLDVLLITASAMAICFLATLYPSRQASKLNPVRAIHEG
jgi:lipoprotein-releasing system permease protein